MRLLTRRNGEFTLTEDLPQNKIPRYAILSHTWSLVANDEITFKDINDGLLDLHEKRPGGYRKLLFCADQAAQDGIDYFWIDTCCINKDNLRELDEAIRSMYRWYQCAAKCYVYLSDVNVANPDNQQFWEHSFVQSRWFTRGWTLQELLAPRDVAFFCAEGFHLGDKATLLELLSENTGIALEALQGKPLAEFGLEERLSWARHRHTQLEEDKAYCLLGIFDVNMPIMYGERKANAMRRLKDEIHRADGAAETSNTASAAGLSPTKRMTPGPSTQAAPLSTPRKAPRPTTQATSPLIQRVAPRTTTGEEPIRATRVAPTPTTQAAALGPAASEIQILTLEIGNIHRVARSGHASGQNRHQWNFFVRPNDTDVIEAVHVFLHETFADPHLIFNQPPYEVQRIGWGTFTVTAIVVLKNRLQIFSSDVCEVNLARQTSESTAVVSCTERGCGKTFIFDGDARSHFQTAHMSETERNLRLFKQYGRGFYPCPDEDCEKVFVSATHARTHWNGTHLLSSRYPWAPRTENPLDEAIRNVLKVDWSLCFNGFGSKSTYTFEIRVPADFRSESRR